MGIFDSLFGGDKGATPKRIAAQVAIVELRHGEPARRYGAMEKLAEWGTPEAIEGLLRRFTVTAEKETSDEDEKTWLAELLEEKGAELVAPAIERYLRTETNVNWPLRILSKLVDAESYQAAVAKILEGLDIHFDRQPERKVELIHAIESDAPSDSVLKAVVPFLDDTDDTVRIAAAGLVAKSDRDEHVEALVEGLIVSGDRPRVRAALCAALADNERSVKGRKAEVEPCLPEGYYLTRQGAVKRLGQSS